MGKKIAIGCGIVVLLLFVVVEVASVVQAQQTERLRVEIVKAGGKSTIERQPPGWLRSLMGPDFHSFLDAPVIVQALLNGPKVNDAGLQGLEGLADVRLIDLSDSSISDAGLVHLVPMKRLNAVNLRRTQVTNLEPLQALPQLEHLTLDFTQVPETGFEALNRFPALKTVSLKGLHVTGAGTALLAKCAQLENLSLDVADLGEDGLAPLHALTGLKVLSLKDAVYSLADLEQFRKAVPGCKVVQ